VHEIYRDLTSPQIEAAEANDAVLVLAGAGTGKTKTLVAACARRIIKDDMLPSKICVVTFTNEAARGMKRRLEDIVGPARCPTAMGTFHSIALRQLRYNPEVAGLRPGFHVVSPQDVRPLAREVLLREGVVDGDEKLLSSTVNDFLAFVSILKANMVTPEDLEARDGEPEFPLDPMNPDFSLTPVPGYKREDMPAIVRRVYGPYQEFMTSKNLADFDDLLLWVTVMMVRSPEYRQFCSSRYEALLVDEFQDVNLVQYVWTKSMASSHGQIFVVGDDGQSIFGWRGSKVEFIRNFATKDYPSARFIVLDKNFRSTTHILDCGNKVLRNDPQSLDKSLSSDFGPGLEPVIRGFNTDDEEAQFVATEVMRLSNAGHRMSDVAVLYRTNRIGCKIESELSRLGLPSHTVDGFSFWERTEIKMAISVVAVINLWDSKQSDIYAARTINIPSRGVGDVSIELIKDYARNHGVPFTRACGDVVEKRLLKGRALKGVAEWLDRMETLREEGVTGLHVARQLYAGLEGLGYLQYLKDLADEETPRKVSDDEASVAAERLGNLSDLHQVASMCQNFEDLHERILVSVRSNVAADAVTLMSVHSSKGLEFETVFMVGVDDGIFPNYRADVAEEWRLAYVGITRAKRNLTLTWCRRRMGEISGPSNILKHLPTGSIMVKGVSYRDDGSQGYERTSAEARNNPFMKMSAHGRNPIRFPRMTG